MDEPLLMADLDKLTDEELDRIGVTCRSSTTTSRDSYRSERKVDR
jgi:hypothetical protein